MKYSEAVKAHGYYLCGASLSKTGKKFGVDRRLLYYYFKSFNLSTRPLVRRKSVEYNGDVYASHSGGYRRKTTGDRELLHRQVWKDAYGEIPRGFNIHHINGDKLDNRLENLEMLSASEHTKKHGFRNNQHTKLNPENYVYLDKPECHECGKEIKIKDPCYNRSRLFCSKTCRYAHAKRMPFGYSLERIIKMICA